MAASGNVSLIGRFGVDLYSANSVSDKVRFVNKLSNDEQCAIGGSNGRKDFMPAHCLDVALIGPHGQLRARLLLPQR